MLLNHLNQKALNALILLVIVLITVHHVILVTMHLLMVQNRFMLHSEPQNCCYLTLSPPQDFPRIQSVNCCYTILLHLLKLLHYIEDILRYTTVLVEYYSLSGWKTKDTVSKEGPFWLWTGWCENSTENRLMLAAMTRYCIHHPGICWDRLGVLQVMLAHGSMRKISQKNAWK